MVHSSAYKQIYDGKEMNRRICGHISKKMTPPQAELQAGPSAGVPQKKATITGEDSSLHVPAPKDLPVGQDMEVETVILMVLML